MRMDECSAPDVLRLAPPADVGEMGECGHVVQFYEADAFLLDGVSRFIGGGLEREGGSVVIATRSHLADLEQRLRERGVDVAAARRQEQYVAADAAATLAEFMDGGSPNEERFAAVVGGLLARAAGGRRGRVLVFGEMVALLWAQGNAKAALRLEELWNRLGRRHAFSLLCAYPMRGFGTAARGKPFLQICAEHSRVIPAESYAALPSADERLRVIAELQQKANALEAEIAERRRVEQERTELLTRERAARTQAEAASRSKDEFLATLSHELRTPLTAMLGWVRMLRSGQLQPEKVAHALEVLDRNTLAQVRLIEDLLDVSRIITGKLRLEVRPLELMGVIRAALEAVRPAAQAKGIRLDSAFDPSAGSIVGDPDRWQQIVWNLLSNAVKYTSAGGRVEVRLDRVTSKARITVKDTGIGIDADFLPYVFDRFSQVERGTARAYAGLGLGLAIVRHLVELHGGSVRADSLGEGQGATFIVEVPVGAVEAETRWPGRRR